MNSTLLIFDPHQDTAWIQRILKKERGRFARLILGGDYFDEKSDSASDLTDMCTYLLDLQQEFGERMTLLLGNHDIQYLEAMPAMRQHRNPHRLRYKISGAYSNSRAKKLSKRLGQQFWNQAQLFTTDHGYLISHAGLHESFWPIAENEAASLEQFRYHCKETLLNIATREAPLLSAGIARAGLQAHGGITWLDFNQEFRDSLPMPQLFGHTPDFSDSTLERARQRGRSWCLDGAQTIYALLGEDGLRIHSA